MRKNNIEILVKLPVNWMDIEKGSMMFGLMHTTIRDEVRKALKEVLVEHYITKINLPEIKIDKKELRNKIMERMADSIIEKIETR